MKILLDTNIIIHREASGTKKTEIGYLFNWIDKLKYAKYIHPITIEELNRNKDEKTVAAMNIKIQSYNFIKNLASMGEKIVSVSNQIDTANNDINDTKILNEVFEDRVDYLISEDKKIHTKARLLGISQKVFKIQSFLEKVTSENPELVDYRVLAVKKVDFGEVDVNDSFFDSFREDYAEFNSWFNKKADEQCYICINNGILMAFLYVKIENENDNYAEITPGFSKKKRLKIGTLKVSGNGYKIGERFLKTVFDNALQYKVDEIYVTLFNKRPEQEQLIDLLSEWGFAYHGSKVTSNGAENVFTRAFSKSLPVNIENPKQTFPFFSRDTEKYIIKIQPQYHSELFPDSINTREDITKYTENEPHRNRIAKVYISHSSDRNLKAGDILVIYRIGDKFPKKYSSTVTTICIVESVINNIKTFEDFYEACNRKTVIKRDALKSLWWDRHTYLKPFVINLLYAHSFPTPKPTLDDLNRLKIIPNILDMPKGFIKISKGQFNTLLNFAYRKQ